VGGDAGAVEGECFSALSAYHQQIVFPFADDLSWEVEREKRGREEDERRKKDKPNA
jgi:hypothetical protein